MIGRANRKENMDYRDRVAVAFDEGFNCAEAMVRAFAEPLGMPAETTRMATPFGGGLSRSGRVCGLVSGAVMVLGWALGRTHAGDLDAREAAYAAARRLVQHVESLTGASTCLGILGVDLREPEGRLQAETEDLYAKTCHRLASKIAETVAQILHEAEVLP